MPSDVFSLGAVFTLAATGRGPFGTRSTAALVYRMTHGTPDLDDSPADLSGPGSGAAWPGNPSDGQTAQDLLAELGDTELTEGWLPAWSDSGRYSSPPVQILAAGLSTRSRSARTAVSCRQQQRMHLSVAA